MAVISDQLPVVSEPDLRERCGPRRGANLLTGQLEIDAAVGVDLGDGRNIQFAQGPPEPWNRPQLAVILLARMAEGRVFLEAP